ncbi:paraquat-inducible protein A [Dawidia soli]|uniref:Paraquat-inducible protein A n=1 Tax=Dawidia soli TaxID=2782352 RepID=A0AAP2DE06_9BACT|nr:paraquat-inducible protein A [Dawidia soli]MBT1690329.1 paraquat-inducible protein A [Dawidia soli]
MITLQRTLIIFIGGLLLCIAGWCGLQVYQLSATRATIKKDYSVLNNITYGLLSVNAWRDHMVRVVTHRIDDFEFTPEQEAALKHEVSQVLHAVIHKADSMIDRKQRTVGGKIKKFAVKTLVNENKLHDRVPEFAQTIVNEVKKPKNREKLKYLAQSKLQEFGTITYDSVNDVNRLEEIMKKYGTADVVSFNKTVETRLASLQDRAYFFTYAMVGILIFFLLMWWLLRSRQPLHAPFFILSVLLALLVLCVGLTTPMIEIDARIKEMSFLLIGEPISFHDQVIFFQSKSIVDVVRILLETGKYDSVVVGMLILIFSIVFPIGKLLATKVYLLGNQRWRDNKVVQFFAFKAGKWSMADVNVVAIFMAYIGFKGILDSQLAHLNMKTDSLASISTNETSLQPGFILFVSFVLFGLILSVILQHITLPGVERAATIKQRSERSSLLWRRLITPASRYFHS